MTGQTAQLPGKKMNPDQALIRAFQSTGLPMEVDSNPLAVALGMHLLRVDVNTEQIELGFRPDPIFIQGAGVIQGGAVTAMLDFAMAFVTLAQGQDGQSCASINLNTSFVRPARAGQLRCVGSLVKRGRQIVFASAELFTDDGVLVATATSALAVG